MFWLAFFLAVASAAEIEVHSDGLVLLEVDGAPRPYQLDRSRAVASDLAGGRHTIALAAPFEGVVDYRVVQLRADERRVYQLVGDQLSLVRTETVRPPPAPAAAPPPPAGPTPISDPEMARLLDALDAEHFSDDKLDRIAAAARRHHFETGQVARLLDALPFADVKAEALDVLRPRILDPDRAGRLEDAVAMSR